MLIIQLILNWSFLFLKEKRRNTVKHSVWVLIVKKNLQPKKQIRLKEHERQNNSNQTGGSNKTDQNGDLKSCTVTPSASVTKFATFTSQIKEDINQGVGELVKKAASTPTSTTTTNATMITTTSMTKKIDPDSINGASKITTKTANLKR